MALVRIDEKTLIQKLKIFIIGSEKPNWGTRLSVLLGFTVWIYYFLYLTVMALSILFVDRLKDPALIKSTFGKIGGKYNFNIRYEALNWAAIDVILAYALISSAILLLSLLGLIYIYRRKKLGYILYLSGNILVVLFTLFFLGLTYVSEQISNVDKVLFVIMTLYFFVAMLFLKRGAENVTTEPQS
jgi:hypothetical protein